VLEKPLFMQGNTYAARRLRELVGYVFDVEGVISPATGALKVGPRAAGANRSVDVAAGTAAILGDDAAGQGMYLAPSTAIENLPIGEPPGSDSRIDLVIARIRDAAVTGGVSSDWLLEVLPGTVAAAPVEPALPNSAIRLGAVKVAAGTTSITAAMITDRRVAATHTAYAQLVTATAADGLTRGFGSSTTVTLTGTIAVPVGWQSYLLICAWTTRIHNAGTTTRDAVVSVAYDGAVIGFGTQGHTQRVLGGAVEILSVNLQSEPQTVTGDRSVAVTVTLSALDSNVNVDNQIMTVFAVRKT
jgi:hypothetical protein